MPAKKVLVVDDHQDSRDICQQLLSHYGYDVVVAANGAEAIREALLQVPDMILLDFLMPHGNGLETLARLQTEPTLSQTKIVLYTAAITERDALLAVDGVARVLFKPVETAHLLETVRMLIGA